MTMRELYICPSKALQKKHRYDEGLENTAFWPGAGKTVRLAISTLSLLALLLMMTSPVDAKVLKLKRGVSIHEWLNWSPVYKRGTNSYIWPPYNKKSVEISTDDFDKISKTGFDFVRLSIDPGPVLSTHGAKRLEALEILKTALKMVLKTDLNIIFDYHPVSQVPDYWRDEIDRDVSHIRVRNYRQAVRQTAKMLQELAPHRIAFEFRNEPRYSPCVGKGAAQWAKVQKSFVEAARPVAPDLTFIVTGNCYGKHTGLVQLNPDSLNDDNLIYSFHYYEPHFFTHQGTGGRMKLLSGIPWPASKRPLKEALASSLRHDGAGQTGLLLKRLRNHHKTQKMLRQYYKENHSEKTVEQDFREIMRWARKYRLRGNRLLLGEFGVSAATHHRRGAGPRDRARWLRKIRRLAERYGMAWAIWEYNNKYGMSLLSDSWARQVDPVILRALGLKPR